jgi:hypothetical protein
MKGRPAETTTGVGSIALLVAYIMGVDDPQTIAILGAGLGLVPAAVTLLVAGGGIRGVLGNIWRGKAPGPAANVASEQPDSTQEHEPWSQTKP